MRMSPWLLPNPPVGYKGPAGAPGAFSPLQDVNPLNPAAATLQQDMSAAAPDNR